MIRSAAFPGFGQLYNRRPFKALIVLGAEAGLAGAAYYQNQRAQKSQSADEKRFYQNDRSRFVWYLVAVHLLNILDAYVDAYLSDFDTGPDLGAFIHREDVYPLLSFSIPIRKAE